MNQSLSKIGGAVVALSAIAFTFAGIASARAPKSGREVAAIGQPAPEWSLKDTSGETQSLSKYQGKIVVLEWTNNTCPFVKKHYNSGNMQSLQKFAKNHGVVWFSVVSSAPGAQGYVTPEQGAEISKEQKSQATAKLLDPEGEVGHEYQAKTTPDIMIIDQKGTLVYSGGIDDKPTLDVADIKTAHNYVRAALEEVLAGKPVTTPTSQPYGCGIKYAN
jgi:hypothetical protein